jgi:hypothetical protein
MIREFAFSLHRRHYFQGSEEESDWQGLNSDTFMSLYEYDDYVKEFFASKNTLAGYDGQIYLPDEFILDVDGSNIDNAKDKTHGLLMFLNDNDIPYNVYFSGTGFHVGIPSDAFRWKPHRDLHIQVKRALTDSGVFEWADPAVTDKPRLIRVVNTRNTKSGLYKVQIDPKWVNPGEDTENILNYAKAPKKLINNVMECNPIFDVLIASKPKKQAEKAIVDQGRNADPSNYPCISAMLESNAVGKRHNVALRIAAWFRWLYPEVVVRYLMEGWRLKVDNPRSPFKKEEMDKIVTNCYDGHGGHGYRYGCSDPIMDHYCKNTCKLYKTKKSQSTMDASSMENVLIDFYKKDLKPIDIGKIYGQTFPIYPGEVVILQAPPASMKTMLLQNWMNHFKKPTYFVEMEMSPRQIWSRFVMIEKGWTEEELIAHYSSMQNGLDEEFKWLTVDYSSCYPFELDKKISMLPTKPEIVVVDHMGLFRSKQKDNNMKVEEASQALMDIAVKHNIIVFTVSEISKTAFKEGMDISSSRGSFRIAYNANKLLSLKPCRDQDGMIDTLILKSDKNREKEQMRVELKVDNVKIVPL